MNKNDNSFINRFVNKLPFEKHLIDPKVRTYAACGPGTKTKKRITQFLLKNMILNVKPEGFYTMSHEEIENLICGKDTSMLFKNPLDKECFLHDLSNSKYKTHVGRHISDSDLIEGAKKILQSNVDKYQKFFANLIIRFCSKKIQSGQGL